MERPRQKGAKWTNKHIAPDEKVEDIKLETYEARRGPLERIRGVRLL